MSFHKPCSPEQKRKREGDINLDIVMGHTYICGGVKFS